MPKIISTSPFALSDSTSRESELGSVPTELHEVPVDKSRLHRMNEMILSGASVEKAARVVAPGSNPHSMESALMKHKSIVERNTELFERAGMKEVDPYKVLIDTMQNAWKTMPFTDTSGKVVYKKVPDYAVRQSAAKTIITLKGGDPRAEMKMQITTMGNGQSVTQVLIGNAYIEIANHSNPEEQLAAYNEMQRNARQNNYLIVGQSEEEKQGRVLVEPNGSGVASNGSPSQVCD